TQDNLDLIKSKNYDYICVSRTRPAKFDFLSENATIINDNRGNKIEVQKVFVEDKDDCFLHIKSDQKGLKEASMDEKITQRFEERMNHLKQGLSLPRRTKTIVAVHETIGRIKDQF
ncbi:hypothetical protein DMA11_25520, partial [Marinilabiliaceae bacterium JC017]